MPFDAERGAAAWRGATVALLLAVIIICPHAAAGGEVVDSAGRKVAIPERVERVIAAGPPASALMTILAPEKLLGWNRKPLDAELPYLPPTVRNLPVIGRLTGRGNTANLETVMAQKPDLIVDFGTIAETYITLADRTQTQTGIPYLLVDGRFAQTVQSLKMLGPILGVAARAELLAQRFQSVLDRLDAVLKTVPDDARPRVYMARRANGLETSYRGSLNTEIIERAGGRNVVDTGALQGGLVNVSLEQVLAWNPDTIITNDADFANNVQTASVWQNVAAVQRKRVYLGPSLPFGWIDEPPALNRTLGLVWLSHIFFPDRFPGEIRGEVRDFYRLFYQVDLSDVELDRLLAGSARPH